MHDAIIPTRCLFSSSSLFVRAMRNEQEHFLFFFFIDFFFFWAGAGKNNSFFLFFSIKCSKEKGVDVGYSGAYLLCVKAEIV